MLKIQRRSQRLQGRATDKQRSAPFTTAARITPRFPAIQTGRQMEWEDVSTWPFPKRNWWVSLTNGGITTPCCSHSCWNSSRVSRPMIVRPHPLSKTPKPGLENQHHLCRVSGRGNIRLFLSQLLNHGQVQFGHGYKVRLILHHSGSRCRRGCCRLAGNLWRLELCTPWPSGLYGRNDCR